MENEIYFKYSSRSQEKNDKSKENSQKVCDDKIDPKSFDFYNYAFIFNT